MLLASASPAWACDDWLAKAVAITGAVERKAAADWQSLQTEQVVCPGDSVRVGANSRAALYLRNNSFMRLDENSLVNFPAPKQDGGYWLDLSQGFAHFISRIVNRFEVSTPYVNAVVEGTEFIVSAAPAQASVAVMEGKVKTYNDAGTESITSGQQVQTTSRTASLTRLTVPSASTVEWAIYYPPVLTLNSIQPLTPDEKNRLEALQPFLQQNRPDLALQTLEQNPASTPALNVARAALLLAVGRVDDFDASISTQLSGPHAGTAYALKAVADAARNRAEPALASAHKAVELAPQQAASHIALSYAQQASLQLNDALASAKQATRAEPGNALGWLRLTELHLTQGDTGAAEKALAQIEKLPAEQQQPKAAILSAKGFVNLFGLKIKAARDDFDQAIQQDSADPQNHLGLGLALLRDGKLEDGRRQLEYAVSLDPLRSTFRSYLGRAYFEEKRDGEAIKQWELAKQFDPNDPTPYFYTGVHKLFANDPIGAIDELETSKELNDKRAIYRDETLLQSDAASRSATLARAYNEVGYDQGVLLNGWDAIRRDPTNSEGHRLLADKFTGDSRYESARASELLQSQLWQPLSAYPLQPQLSETNISLVDGNGPQRPSLNEYHSLFTQDGFYGMANGYGGSDGTWGDDLVGSFLAGPLAVSLGQYHFETDGWRENSDQTQDIYNGLVQWQANSDTSFQFESRKLDWSKGNVSPQFSELVVDIARTDVDQETYRFGFQHFLGGATYLIGNFAKQSSSTDRAREVSVLNSLQSQDQEDVSSEVQFVSLMPSVNFVYGVGYTKSKSESVDFDHQEFVDPEDDTVFYIYENQVNQTKDPEQSNAYLYYFSKPTDFLEVNVGLAYEKIEQDIETNSNELFEGYFEDGTLLFSEAASVDPVSVNDARDEWLPKLGVGFNFENGIYVRAAAFKTLKRRLTANQTIEPAVFTGFVQHYDEAWGAEAVNYAAAVDYVVKDRVGLGFSYTARDVSSPFLRPDFVSFGTLDYKVSMSDFYTLYMPKDWVSFTFGLTHEVTKADDKSSASAIAASTRRYAVPVTVELFSSSGVSFGVAQTYYDQSVLQTAASSRLDKSDWVTDMFLRCRLPSRLGYVELGAKNLLDENEEYVSYDGSELAFYPSRFVYAVLNINL